MKALSILALLTIASPAFAETPADTQKAPAQDQKPYVNDGPGLNSFSPPAPVTIGGVTVAPSPNGGKPVLAPPPPGTRHIPTFPKIDLG